MYFLDYSNLYIKYRLYKLLTLAQFDIFDHQLFVHVTNFGLSG